MKDSNSWKSLLIAAGGGLAGFIVLLLAEFVFLFILARHIFGGALSIWENITILGLIPTTIAFGAGIPARVLEANLGRCSVAGITAMLVFVFIEIGGGQSYGPFSDYETAAFVLAALTTVLIATTERNRLPSSGLAILVIVTVALSGIRFILLEEDILAGFIVSLLAWIILPAAGAFFMLSEQKTEVQTS